MSDKIKIQAIHDLIEDNGKSIKENNLEKTHEFGVGDLVEIFDFGDHNGVRLYIVSLDRDCDGTPLYSLCANRSDTERNRVGFKNYSWDSGYPASILKLIKSGKL